MQCNFTSVLKINFTSSLYFSEFYWSFAFSFSKIFSWDHSILKYFPYSVWFLHKNVYFLKVIITRSFYFSVFSISFTICVSSKFFCRQVRILRFQMDKERIDLNKIAKALASSPFMRCRCRASSFSSAAGIFFEFSNTRYTL